MERSPEISQQFLELVQGVNTISAVESAKKLEEFLQTKIPGADAIGAAARDLLAIYGTADDILLIKILSVCIRRLLEGLENNDSPLASDEMFRAVAKHLVTHGEQDDDFHLKLFELLGVVVDRVPSFHPGDAGLAACFCSESVMHLQSKIRAMALNIFRRLIQKAGPEQFTTLLEELSKFLTHHDETTCEAAILTFVELAKGVDEAQIKLVVEKLAVTLLVVVRYDLVMVLLSCIADLASKTKFLEAVLDAQIDLELVYDMCKGAGHDDDIFESILKVVGSVLATEQENFKKKQDEFANQIGPFVVDAVLLGVRDRDLCGDVLVKICRFSLPVNIHDLMDCLPNLISGNNRNFAAKLITGIEELGLARGFFFESDSIIKALEASGCEDAAALCDTIRKGKSQGDPREPELLLDDSESLENNLRNNANVLIRIGPTRAKTYLEEGLIPLLKKMPAKDIPDDIWDSVVDLSDTILIPIMSKYALKLQNEGAMTIKEFVEQKLSITVTDASGSRSVSLPILSDFFALEMWYNETESNVDNAKLVDAFKSKPELVTILKASDVESASGSMAAFLHRICKTPGYKCLKFVVNGATFSVHNDILQAFGLQHPGRLDLTQPLEVQIVPIPSDECVPLYEMSGVSNEDAYKEMLAAVKLMVELHSIRDNLDVSVLRQTVENYVQVSYLDATKTDPIYSLCVAIRDSIPMDVRAYLAESTLSDCRHSVKRICDRCYPFENVQLPPEVFHCNIRRENFWDDALVLLEQIAKCNFDFEINFVDETGYGPCTVVEFFSLLASEMCRSSRHLWVSSDESGEFVAIPDCGLYPRAADPHIIYLLGVAVAKAFSMSCQFPLPLHSALFELALCDDVSSIRDDIYEEIDSEAACLADPECLLGLTFELFATEIPLVEGGADMEVDRTNVDEYIRLSKEKVISIDLVKEFRRGFCEILPWRITSLFSPKELSSIFGSSDFDMTTIRLGEHIVLEGYERDSPQFTEFCTCLATMTSEEFKQLLRFVTGSRYLPRNGIAGLSPKFTISRWEPADDVRNYLPTAVPCQHVLRIPPYPPGILPNKLKYAIRESNDGFYLDVESEK